jgi:hypothetical protein
MKTRLTLKTFIPSLFISFLVPFNVLAAPVISPLSNTSINHGQTITINGSGFGSKSTASPQLWDTVDNQAAYSGLSNGSTVPTGSGKPWEAQCNWGGGACVKYSTSPSDQRGVGTATYKSTNTNFAFLEGKRLTGTTKTYVSWWWKPSQTPSGGSSKFIRMSNSGDLTNKTLSWTQMHNYVYGPEGYCNSEGWASWNGTANQWNFMEAWIDSEKRTYTLRINGNASSANNTSWAGCASFNFDYVWTIGQDGDPPAVTMDTWLDDIYVDNTFQRVMIGNASTYSASTKFEMQPPVSWLDGQVQISVNQGGYATGSSAYLYVIDAAGNASNGQLIIFGAMGSGSPDTTAPTTAITSPLSGTVSGTTTIAATASDSVGVTKVELYVDGSLNATDTTSPYSFSLNTTALANAAHTLYTKAHDAAGNVGQSSSITVTVSNAAVDYTLPTTAITAPTSGTVSGTTSVTASASDNVSVTKVELYVDGSLNATDTTSPYSFSLNTTALTNAAHTLYTKGYDAAGNVGQSSSITVTVSNTPADSTLPTTAITSPTTGTVSGTIAVTASASDNVGVTKVELYVDGSLNSIDTASPYSFSLNTTSLTNAPHTLYTKAYDAAGNVRQSSTVTVTVNNVAVDSTLPTSVITSPISGTVSGTTTVAATASDNVGVTKVELYVDGALYGTDTTSPYSFSWDTTSQTNGSRSLYAKSYDAAGNAGQSSTITVTVSNTASPSAYVPRNECLNVPAGTVFCEDFEGSNPKSNFNDYDGNPSTENMIVIDNGPSVDSLNKVIQLRVPAGQAGGSDLIKVLPSTHDKLYARWYFKYEPGFNFSAPNHGGGLAAGSRDYMGQSGIRPTGADWAGFFMQYMESTSKPYTYSYYRGMYQDCSDPNSNCYGDSLPCVYDSGSQYCTKAADRPTVTLPNLVAGQWYCYEQMVDMGTATSTGTGATGRVTQWLDGAQIADNSNLWLRTTSSLKLQNLWLSLYHHDGTHSTAGEMIDNVVVSSQRIGCGTVAVPSAPNFRLISDTP